MIQPEYRDQLSWLAFRSISHGVQHRHPLPVDLADWPEQLRESRASFVTLYKQEQLRGCIGSLAPTMPLVQDVAEHAFAAAFKDPRFSPVSESELDSINVHLSVLSDPEPLTFSTEAHLLEQIVPGRDGLIIHEGGRRGTFLPSVWDKLPERRQFLQQLKRKAGLPEDYWSETIRVERYTTESW